MSNGDIREACLTLARVMTTQVNIDIRPMVNAMESSMTSRLRGIVRMNPPTFFSSKVGEDPQAFLDEMYTIVHAMRMTFWEESGLSFI